MASVLGSSACRQEQLTRSRTNILRQTRGGGLNDAPGGGGEGAEGVQQEQKGQSQNGTPYQYHREIHAIAAQPKKNADEQRNHEHRHKVDDLKTGGLANSVNVNVGAGRQDEERAHVDAGEVWCTGRTVPIFGPHVKQALTQMAASIRSNINGLRKFPAANPPD